MHLIIRACLGFVASGIYLLMSSSLGPYKSSWVDEMTDYLRSNDFEADGYSDEEEEDDLDGFVASDDEVEDMEDYSTEISKIFGYDRRK